MTSWVITIDGEMPDHWNLGKQAGFWDLPSPRRIGTGDDLFFWLGGPGLIGWATATSDAYEHMTKDGPWLDYDRRTYVQRVNITPRADEPTVRLTWDELKASLGLKGGLNIAPRRVASTEAEQYLRSLFASPSPKPDLSFADPRQEVQVHLHNLTDPQAVHSAMAEFDRRGRDDFLSHYGFARARGYFVEADGEKYDSKAIAGVAHKYQHGQLLTASMFSGGERSVARRLASLGFTVTQSTALPNWTADELMLALNAYLNAGPDRSLGPSDETVKSLSAELRSMKIFPDEVRANPRFRNPDGVALKLHNFASLDERRSGKGMAHGGNEDRRVWERWGHNAKDLAQAVDAIRQLNAREDLPPETNEEEEYAAPEGRVLYRQHRRYERDRALVRKKKRAVLKETGRLACEVCDFESSEAFDIEGVIDVHHVVPLHRIGESLTTLKDLSLVCPTCHRVLHGHRPIITPSELRSRARRR